MLGKEESCACASTCIRVSTECSMPQYHSTEDWLKSVAVSCPESVLSSRSAVGRCVCHWQKFAVGADPVQSGDPPEKHWR